MKVSLTGGESYTLTSQTIDKLLRAKDANAALLYLHILRTDGQNTEKQMAAALCLSTGEVATATALLSRMGLIEIEQETNAQAQNQSKNAATGGGALPAEPRAVTQDEVVAEIASGSDFTVVVDETSRRLGKPLSPDDMLRLYGIYENLRLPPEVILQLITHCISECQLTGEGRTPSVRYIEKAAYTWEREGIFTIEKAEEYLKALEEKRSNRGMVKRILQIRGREFSVTELHFIDSWLAMGFEFDVIALAYDKTVVNTGSLAYPYMDAILKKWRDKGLLTLAQVEEAEGVSRKKDGAYSAVPAAQKHGEPNRAQIEQMTKLLESMKKDE